MLPLFRAVLTIIQIRDGSKAVSDSKQIANALNIATLLMSGLDLLAELKSHQAMILFVIFIIVQKKQSSN